MKERPILFSAPMVRALLAGTKTQTRRIVKPQPAGAWAAPGKTACPYGAPGDRLWVREAWHVGKCADGLKPRELHPGTWLQDNGGLWIPADNTEPAHPISPRGRYRHARFMPRWASRLTLEVTGIRVERLQSISEADAQAEGIARWGDRGGWHTEDGRHYHAIDPRESYAALWEQINGAGSWEANPWLWVVEFGKLAQP